MSWEAVAAIAETERLEFRRFQAEDAEGFFQLNNDPEVVRYTGDVAFNSVNEARDFLAAYGHYAAHGYGRWSLYSKKSGEYVGFCGLNYSAAKDEVDLGFRIKREYWNTGLATEAGACALRLGFEQFGIKRIVGRAMRDNPASQRVLEKLGMTRVGEFEEEGQVWVQYSRMKE